MSSRRGENGTDTTTTAGEGSTAASLVGLFVPPPAVDDEDDGGARGAVPPPPPHRSTEKSPLLGDLFEEETPKIGSRKKITAPPTTKPPLVATRPQHLLSEGRLPSIREIPVKFPVDQDEDGWEKLEEYVRSIPTRLRGAFRSASSVGRGCVTEATNASTWVGAFMG